MQRLKNIAYNGERVQKHAAPVKSADHDPWAVEPAPKDPRFSFIPEKQAKVEPVTIRHAPISLAASGKPFAAVRKPEGGKSYNPDFEEWQALLTREGEKEVEAERQRLHEARLEAEKLEKALAEAAKPDPVSDEEYESAWESEWEGIQSEGEEAAAWLSKKRPERKTPAERNKIKRRKEAERQDKWNKQMKKRDEQQARIRQIAAELRKKEENARKAQVALVGEESDGEQNEEKLRRRRLGKNPVPEAPLEVVLADELQDSLRALKPEGNLLKDRYRNLLLNGKVEARRQAVHKKPKRERTEKWSYKDWSLK